MTFTVTSFMTARMGRMKKIVVSIDINFFRFLLLKPRLIIIIIIIITFIIERLILVFLSTLTFSYKEMSL